MRKHASLSYHDYKKFHKTWHSVQTIIIYQVVTAISNTRKNKEIITKTSYDHLTTVRRVGLRMTKLPSFHDEAEKPLEWSKEFDTLQNC